MTMRYAKISRDHARKSIGVLDSIIPTLVHETAPISPPEPIFENLEKMSSDVNHLITVR